MPFGVSPQALVQAAFCGPDVSDVLAALETPAACTEPGRGPEPGRPHSRKFVNNLVPRAPIIFRSLIPIVYLEAVVGDARPQLSRLTPDEENDNDPFRTPA